MEGVRAVFFVITVVLCGICGLVNIPRCLRECKEKCVH